MYALGNVVYLVLGILLNVVGAVLMIGAYPYLGLVVAVLGLAMSTFAAFQMGQGSGTRRN